jgi:hypothetical protein
MFLSRIGWELAVLAVLCVVAIFFFPAMQGPYSAVNGPVTALQSAQAAVRVRVGIVQAALSLIGNFQIPSQTWVRSATVVGIEAQAPSFVDCSAILRC